MAAYDYDISSHDNLLELAYAAAYLDDSPLGHSKFCPSYKVGSFSAAALRDFVGAKFTADNIVISASGVNHNNFVRDVSRAFGGLASGAVTAAPAKYLGGEYRVRGPGNVAYFALSFEAPSASASLKGTREMSVCVCVAVLDLSGSHTSNLFQTWRLFRCSMQLWVPPWCDVKALATAVAALLL